MGRDLLFKLGIIAAVVVASVVLAMPPREKVHLGLDLQGGLHLLLEVQVDKATDSISNCLSDAYCYCNCDGNTLWLVRNNSDWRQHRAGHNGHR